jgi:hypothetical protein
VRRAIFATLALLLRTSIAGAQLGELQFGVLAGYAEKESHHAGVGLTFAVVPGRVTYLGLRYVHYAGGTVRREDVKTGTDYNVETRARLIAADLGFQFPVGRFELVLGSSLGVTAFRQEVRQVMGTTLGSPHVGDAWEFTAAPGATLFIRAGRFLIAPEFQWMFAGSPDIEYIELGMFTPYVASSGPHLSLRFVVPFEIDRIRQ